MERWESTFYVIGSTNLMVRKRRDLFANSTTYDYYNEVIDRMVPDSNSLMDIIRVATTAKKIKEVDEVEWAKMIQAHRKNHNNG